MYLRCNRRLKDGKEHRYWNIVESKRCGGGKVVQRNVLYLGEINDSQRESWCQVIEAFDEGTRQPTQLALFPAERAVPDHARAYGVQVRLNEMQLHQRSRNAIPEAGRRIGSGSVASLDRWARVRTADADTDGVVSVHPLADVAIPGSACGGVRIFRLFQRFRVLSMDRISPARLFTCTQT